MGGVDVHKAKVCAVNSHLQPRKEDLIPIGKGGKLNIVNKFSLRDVACSMINRLEPRDVGFTFHILDTLKQIL